LAKTLEEHLPLTELADRNGWPNVAHFRWKPKAPADSRSKPMEAFGIQCTTAYPEWPNAVGKTAGHIPFFGGQLSKPTDIRVDLQAWRDRIGSALKAKLDFEIPWPPATHIRRAVWTSLIDFDFAEAVTPAIEAHGTAWREIFQAIYVVDAHEEAFAQLGE
jgi:hypothetical protein